MPEIKKVIDILPPKKLPLIGSNNGKTRVDASSRFTSEEDYISLQENKHKENLSVFTRLLLFVFFIGVASLAVFAYLKLPKAEVKIWPEYKIVRFTQKIVADTKNNSDDPSLWAKNLDIPAKIFEDEKTISQQFSASGNIQKTSFAAGQVRLYNAYSTSSQVLVANTRLISAEGKLFRTIDKVTIPGGKYNKDKLEPGSVDVKVKAAEEGQDSNIEPSTFSIPGFGGTPKYTAFYGKSFTQMSGGFKGTVPQVLQADMDNARNILSEKALQESKSSLNNKVTSDFVILEKALKQEITDSSSSYAVGAEANSFSYTVKAKSTLIAFRKTDLQSLVEASLTNQVSDPEILKSELSKGLKAWPESLKINYSTDEVVFPSASDQALGKITLSLESSSLLVYDIDTKKVKELIVGKTFAEVRANLDDQVVIQKSDIKFWPFWVNKVPGDASRIKIELIVD